MAILGFFNFVNIFLFNKLKTQFLRWILFFFQLLYVSLKVPNIFDNLIIVVKSLSKFPITPHFTKNNSRFIYIGDSLKSIHPVAGQGWNLGIKDIQTLCNLLDQYPLDTENINSLYYSRRFLESAIYLSFTSVLNFLYESKNTFSKKIIKLGFTGLGKIKLARDIFIKQAMGRINLID